MKDVRAKVLYNDQIKGEYFRIGLECGWDTAATEFGSCFDPGQFVMVKVPAEKAFVRRPFSIARAEGKGGIQLIYKVVGEGTVALSSLKEGDSVDVLGPLGRGFSVPEKLSHAIIVAGGFGIAPFVGLTAILSYKSIMTDIYYGGKMADDIFLLEELREKGASCSISTEDGSLGHKGLVTELLERDIDNLLINNKILEYKNTRQGEYKGKTIYCCGPKGLSDAVASIAKKRRLPAQISYEAYMACGFGVCLGCVVKTKGGWKRACKDGPVFDVDELCIK